MTAGPVALSLTVADRQRCRPFVDLARLGIGPEDARQSRLVAGNRRLPGSMRRPALAFGIAEGAKSLERELSGAEAGAFLIARDTSGEPGFAARARRRASRCAATSAPVGADRCRPKTARSFATAASASSTCPIAWPRVSVDRGFGSDLAVARHDPARRTAQPARRADGRRCSAAADRQLVRRRRSAARASAMASAHACRRGAAGPASAAAQFADRGLCLRSRQARACSDDGDRLGLRLVAADADRTAAASR